MLTKEALDVLALRPGATPTEIKEAYRDLVKVWHPDRFGSDPRLRQKADDKLKQLNDAYRVLQSGPVMGDRDGSEGGTAASPSWSDTSSGRYSSPTPSPRHGRARRNIVSAGWIYGFLGISLGCLVGALMFERWLLQPARSLPVSVQTVDTSQRTALAISNAEAPGDVLAKPDLHGAERENGNVGRNDTGRSNRAGPAQYRVFSLPDAQTSQLESACSSQKELHGQAAYQACVKVQLDLSTLSERDRSSIESACRNMKNREGPAAYDRCLMRFIKLLAESK